ncbi:galactose oxidase-like domain-containing protein [Amycolatopsis lurida]
MLLPDGTVFKAGSNGGFGVSVDNTKWVRSRTDAELYLPPYLWRGARLSITGFKAESKPGIGPVLKYSKELAVTANGDNLGGESKVALIRLGATTHGTNTDQRFVWLKVTKRKPGSTDWTISAKPSENPARPPHHPGITTLSWWTRSMCHRSARSSGWPQPDARGRDQESPGRAPRRLGGWRGAGARSAANIKCPVQPDWSRIAELRRIRRESTVVAAFR